MPGVEAEVVDEHGNEVPKGKGGLLALKRPFPHMMRTIWGNHHRYEQYWTKSPAVYMRRAMWRAGIEEGYISVLGRSDDVLNVAGHRIGTADVESALITHPAVAESAVIGIPDELKGEAIKAFVVLAAGRGRERRDAPEHHRACAPRAWPHCHAQPVGFRRKAAQDAQRQDRAAPAQGAGTGQRSRRSEHAGGLNIDVGACASAFHQLNSL
jgi:acyl-coenzyme A synthetase/AMP-(fatty) acid ligase